MEDSLMTIVLLIVVFTMMSLAFWWAIRQYYKQQSKDRLSLKEQLIIRLQNEVKYENERSQDLQKGLTSLNQELKAERERILQLGAKHAGVTARYQGLEKEFNQYKKETSDLREHFYKEFRHLADDILEEKSQKFSNLNKSQLEGILLPLNERISKFEKKVEEANKEGIIQHTALKEQIATLRAMNLKITQEAENLTNALKGDVKQQGSWGEIRLEAILKSAGLTEGIHYLKEKQLTTDKGDIQRPDYIINLPDQKCLIVDSKVSLVAYSKYFGASTEEEKLGFLGQHTQSIQTHIKSLSSKNYEDLHQINQPDYVLMFLANEGALIAALEHKPQLYDIALERNIVIVTSTTLMATLKTVSYIWKSDLQNKNAQEIARQAGTLYDKFVSFTDDLVKIGATLTQSQATYEQAMKKLSQGKGNLVGKTEKLKALGARTSKQLPEEIKDNFRELKNE